MPHYRHSFTLVSSPETGNIGGITHVSVFEAPDASSARKEADKGMWIYPRLGCKVKGEKLEVGILREEIERKKVFEPTKSLRLRKNRNKSHGAKT